ncbi:MAG: RnfH family protein [Corticimicrobacter sp.]|uniref:RnfH family protein n=1 Tax=Corticimicrobacter sp. TaxID=2678536 RepID=UPI0032DA8E1C
MSEKASPESMMILICHVPADVAPWQQCMQIAVGSTVGQALAASDFAMRFPGQDPWLDGVGVHGKMVGPEQVLQADDRIEIYRPLVFDPMESRRRRAAHRQRQKTDRKS